MQPEREIDSALVELDIKARQKRKSIWRNICIIVGLAFLLFIIPHFYSQYAAVYAVDVLIIIFGGLYIGFSGIPNLIQPLEPEFRAFRKIAHAADVLEKSKKEIAYEEVYRDVRSAYVTLKEISLSGIAWYKATNDIFKNFLKDLELIVLPAIEKSLIEKEHLDQMALAIYSLDPLKLAEVNKTLETESNYKETTIKTGEGEGIGQNVLRLFRTYALLKDGLFVSSLTVGCIVFYYIALNYLHAPIGYALTATVAAFIGLFAIYATRRKAEFKSEWQNAK